ncbi:MAG TPA: hypothetical protein VFO85_00020 [Vicinamibacteria bacterium]|nr:hypothetical protein [Vicinamibacteria bacterium]
MPTPPTPDPTRAWLTLVSRCAPEIASALQDELRGWAGTWSVEVDGALVGGWCAYRVIRDDGVTRTLIFAPGEHDAVVVRDALVRALESLPPRPAALLFPIAQERRTVLRR